LGANRVEIRCDAKNERSAAVARRGGFPLEGTLRNEDRCPMTNELRDTLVFAKISAERNT
jgi:RimJ/RimL family protein N-acetyltransferase